MDVFAGESLGNLAVGNHDAQVLIFLQHELFCEHLVDNLLSEVAVVYLTVASLLACIVESQLVVVVLNFHITGFGNGHARAKVSATRCEEVAQDERKQCHDDNDEQQHRLVSDFFKSCH